MEDSLSTDDGLTSSSSLLANYTAFTSMLAESSLAPTPSFSMLSGASGASTPSLDVLTEASLTSSPYVNLSLAGIGEEVEMGDNGNHHYPADMLGFTAACSFIIGIMGTFGNLLTIIALPMTKTLRTTATAFVVNLAVVELLFCLFILPMSGAQYLYLQRHLQGSLLTDTHCIFFVTLRYTLTQVELQTILAIALTRAFAVSVPRFYQSMNRPTVIGVYIAAIWVYALTSRIPPAMGIFGQYMYNTYTMECDLGNAKIARLVYLVTDAFIPVLLIFFLYFFVFIMVKLSSARVARSSTRSQAKVPPPTSSTTSTSSGTGTQRKGSTSSFKSLKKIVSETNLRARFTRQSSTMSQRLTTTRRDMRVARTIFIIFLFVLVCSVPVAVVHGIDPTVKRPVRFLLVHILYWIQYCLNVVVYVLMNRQYRDAYVDCLGRVFPRFQRHRGFRFQWERPSVSSRPQPYLNSTKPNNHGTDSSVSEADQVVPGIPVAAGPGRLTAIPEGHSSSAANDSVFSDAQQKTPESPPTSENKNKENMYREDEKEKEDLREEEEERNEEKLSLMNGQHWVTKNGETISQPDCDSMV